MHLQKIEDVHDYKRDFKSTAIVAVDKNSLAAYKKTKMKQAEFQSAVDDINNIKSDLAEIKNLLRLIMKQKVDI